MNFDEIIEQHGNKIFKYCFHMLRHKQEAEDAAQEVFIKAYRKYENLKDKQAFGSWLYKIAYRYCLNVARRKRLLTFVPMFDNDLLESVEEIQYEISIDVDITAMLDKLSPADRTIIYLKVMEDKNYEEIAAIMGISKVAARKQYERAKTRLRKLYKVESEENINEKVSFI